MAKQNIPPTHQKIILELNSRFSIEVDRWQIDEMIENEDAIYRKDKLVKNTHKSGYHRVIVYRITRYLYNKITAFKTAIGYTLKMLEQFTAPIVEWKYRSCIAILMGRL